MPTHEKNMLSRKFVTGKFDPQSRLHNIVYKHKVASNFMVFCVCLVFYIWATKMAATRTQPYPKNGIVKYNWFFGFVCYYQLVMLNEILGGLQGTMVLRAISQFSHICKQMCNFPR